MQAQNNYLTTSATRTFVEVLKNEGARGVRRMFRSPAYGECISISNGPHVHANRPFRLHLQLYRGLLPPLVGSMIFRSVQFTSYAAMYGATQDSRVLTTDIPFTGGLQPRVLLSALFSSTCRSLVETPLEFIKVRLQTGQTWMKAPTVAQALRSPVAEVVNLYNGFGITWMRCVGLMTSFFIMVDYLERMHPEFISIPFIGPFLKGGLCSTLAWVIIWPFENVGTWRIHVLSTTRAGGTTQCMAFHCCSYLLVASCSTSSLLLHTHTRARARAPVAYHVFPLQLKTQVQANASGVPPGAGWLQRARFVLQHRGGVRGLYRGMGPGTTRALVANGCSMVAFNYCQECMRHMQ